MKFLKFRYVIMTLIVLALGVTALMYFFGGLEAAILYNDNLAYDEDAFTVDMEYLEEKKYNVKFSIINKNNDGIVNQTNIKGVEKALTDLAVSFYKTDVKNQTYFYLKLNAIEDKGKTIELTSIFAKIYDVLFTDQISIENYAEAEGLEVKALTNSASMLDAFAQIKNYIKLIVNVGGVVSESDQEITFDAFLETALRNVNDKVITPVALAAMLQNIAIKEEEIRNMDPNDENKLVKETELANLKTGWATAVGIRKNAVTYLQNSIKAEVVKYLFADLKHKMTIFETEVIVAQNDKYTMFLDETTTTISIGVNSSATDTGNKNVNGYKIYTNWRVIYRTSERTDDKGNLIGGDVVILYYFGKNGQVSKTGLGTFKNSVQYDDLLLGMPTRHYKINYNVENGVEILYEIGSFTNVSSFLPAEIDRLVFESYVRGNFWLGQAGDYATQKTFPQYFDQFEDAEKTRRRMFYTGFGTTTNKECAAYLEENELATVIEAVHNETKESLGYWTLTNATYTEADVIAGRATRSQIGDPKAEIGVHYNTTDPTQSPCTTNPFISDREHGTIFSVGRYELKEKDNEGNPIEGVNKDINQYTEKSPTSYEGKILGANIVAQVRLNVYNILYNIDADVNSSKGNFYRFKSYGGTGTDNPILYYKGEPVVRGGVHARDENGNFMYDEEGKPLRAAFPKSVIDEQNEKYGNTDSATNKIFRVGVRFTLSEKGFEMVLLDNALMEGMTNSGQKDKFSHEYKIAYFDILPHLNINNSGTSEGEIIIPDGSGAVIKFNDKDKDLLNVRTYNSTPIYGLDTTFLLKTAPRDIQNIHLGMYGFLDKTAFKGTVAIVDKGAAQTRIRADFRRESSSEEARKLNYAYFETALRESETVSIGAASSQTSYIKWQETRSKNDFVYKYHFIEPQITETNTLSSKNQTYVKVAEVYREYLKEKYQLKENQDTTENNVVNIKFLGAFDKLTPSFGFATMKPYSLTTFAQAQEIISDLQNYGIESFNVAYQAWTKDAFELKSRSNVTVSDVLGGKKGLTSFAQFLKDNEIAFYPELNVTTNYGFDYMFGDKYISRSVTNIPATHSEYLLSTGAADKTKPMTNMVSPKFYEEILSSYLKKYVRLQLDGLYLKDLGNSRTADYSKKSNISTQDGLMYQQKAMNIANENYNLMLSGAQDYAIAYASNLVDIPVTSTLYQIFDKTIPLYQLILSGLVDYASTPVNYNTNYNSNWHLLKALETGSNLYFVLSAEDTNVLLGTNYTEYYNAYYINWKRKIIQMNAEINEVGIHSGRLVDHEFVDDMDNLVRVTYQKSNSTEKIVLVINYNNTTIAYKNQYIAPNSYIIEGGK